MAVRKTEDIAAEWRREIISPAYWKRALNQGGGPTGAPKAGEAGGCFAESDSLNRRRAYMKPGFRFGDRHDARAAREKIASDLAHDLSFCVPPVILNTRRDPPTVAVRDPRGNTFQHTMEESVCISLVMFPSAFSWEEFYRKLEASPPKNKAVRDLIERGRALLPKEAARALAFDTWVAQMDHHPKNNHNIVFGYDSANPVESATYIFLDYALAFGIGGRWRTPGHAERAEICTVAPMHPMMLAAVDSGELSSMISAIESVTDTNIDAVVQRIPENFMPEAERNAVAAGLKLRRPLLRAALATYLARNP